jgi:hypothetical protein
MVRYRESDIEAWLVEQEVRPSRLIGPSPQGGVGQYFERYERSLARLLPPVESGRPETPAGCAC